jgi:hypothetical protein
MVLACVLFALFTVGLVVPCVIDVATSPPWAIRTASRRIWLLIIIVFSVFGCVAWLIVGRPRRMPLRPRRAPAGLGGMGMSAAEAFRRHPAGRGSRLELEARLDAFHGAAQAPVLGPDDDDEFLLELGRRIRESRDDR